VLVSGPDNTRLGVTRTSGTVFRIHARNSGGTLADLDGIMFGVIGLPQS
jgi:hypothetical protein